jgi:hypothetical protein
VLAAENAAGADPGPLQSLRWRRKDYILTLIKRQFRKLRKCPAGDVSWRVAGQGHQSCKIQIDPIINIHWGGGTCRLSYPSCANLSRGACDSIGTEIAQVAPLRHLSSDKGDST